MRHKAAPKSPTFSTTSNYNPRYTSSVKYVALLRGINVGGKNAVSMAVLKQVFEALGFANVKTYINSGNVLFSTNESIDNLDTKIEQAIEAMFGFRVPVVIRSQSSIAHIIASVPDDWANNADWKVDVMFLWQDFDNKKVLEQVVMKPELDDVQYLPGAIVWRVAQPHVTRSGLMRIAGTDLYKHMTIRNLNTVRKLHGLMQQ